MGQARIIPVPFNDRQAALGICQDTLRQDFKENIKKLSSEGGT
jgi:hypothetical protein